MNQPGDPEIGIRPYEPGSDFEGMVRITREIIGMMPLDEARRELGDYPRKTLTSFVAEGPHREIAGFCAATHPYWNHVAIIEYLVVAAELRGRRIGERLVRRVEEGLAASGVRRVSVQTIDWNRDGIRFYRRLGYDEIARLPHYFEDGHDLVWLDRSLTATCEDRGDQPTGP